MATEALVPFRKHLEQLGYVIDDTDPLILSAAFPEFLVFYDLEGGVIFAAARSVDNVKVAQEPLEFLRKVNEANDASRISRFVTRSGSPSHVYLGIEAWFPNPYDAAGFGAFFADWIHEVRGADSGPLKPYLR